MWCTVALPTLTRGGVGDGERSHLILDPLGDPARAAERTPEASEVVRTQIAGPRLCMPVAVYVAGAGTDALALNPHARQPVGPCVVAAIRACTGKRVGQPPRTPRE